MTGGYHLGCICLLAFTFLLHLATGSLSCVDNNQCGWNSECSLGSCECKEGYRLSHNRRDCIDTYCVDQFCLECTNRHVCHRCVDYIEEETGTCSKSCDTRYALRIQGDQVGKVCKRLDKEGLSMLYIAIIVGTASGILLTILVALVCYFKFRTDRERDLRIKLMSKLMEKEKKFKLEKEVTQFQGTDNPSYDEFDTGRLSRSQYSRQLESLRPHFNTFLVMLKEAKLKSRSLPADDSKVYVYRNISHQLCRVLTLLHDRSSPVPPDADKLLLWAARIHADYLRSKQHPVHVPNITYESMNSSFKPDQSMIPNGGVHTPRVAGHSFNYERYQNSEDSGSQDFRQNAVSLNTTMEEADREISEVSSNIQLLDAYTEPVDV